MRSDALPEGGKLELSREAAIARALRPLLNDAIRSRHEMERIATQLGVSVATLYRKRRLLAEGGGLASSIEPRRPGVKPNSRFLRPDVEEAIAEVIEQAFLTRQRPHLGATVTDIHDRCRELGISEDIWPSRTAIQKRIDAVGRFQTLARREGKDAAEAAHPRPGEFGSSRPNEVWLIDHTLADVMLVHPIWRTELGRPTLTLIIDAYTRMCVGFFVSLGPPSRVQVAMAMLHAIFPKDAWLADRGLAHPWIAWGVPEVVHTDNAREFHSASFKRACADLGIINQWRPLGKPHYGGLIERYIGTTMGDVHLLPGTTFSKPAQRGNYNSQKEAAMTLDAFERWLALNVVKYHASGHQGLGGFSPQSRWASATEAGWLAQVAAPGQARHIMLNFLPSEVRLIRRTGIHFRRLRYWADWLAPSVMQGAGSVEIRYDPRDMSGIWMRAQTGSWERVDLYHRQEPFTLAEHEAALKHLASEAKASRDEGAIHRVRLEQRALVAEEVRLTRRARRAEEHRGRSIRQSRLSLPGPGDLASQSPTPASAQPPPPGSWILGTWRNGRVHRPRRSPLRPDQTQALGSIQAGPGGGATRCQPAARPNTAACAECLGVGTAGGRQICSR